MQRRTIALVGAAVLLLAACGGTGATDQPTNGTTTDPPTTNGTTTDQATTDEAAPETVGTVAPATPVEPFAVDQIASSPTDVAESGIDAWRNQSIPAGFPEPLIELDEIRSGGPPPDGIPPVDEPRFLNTADVDFLADNEPVLALEIDGDARAYPVQILTWHEIVNDTVGGVPVSVTYCPLCNSALAYDRRVAVDGADQILDFGTSGLLLNSSLVMYDRQTETLWSHFTGQGVFGQLTGIELDDFAVSTVAWRTWRDANPGGLVLSRDTGFERSYGRNPYPGYDDVDGIPFLFQGEVDGRYTALTRILGIERNGAAVGVPLPDLQEQQVIVGELDGASFVAWWTAGTSSALDSREIAEGYDVGATGVFSNEAAGAQLTFTPGDDGQFVDDQTGSTWNVLGQAVGGELEGTRLEALPHVDTFWFAWSTFQPDTALVTAAG
jgi:hypothetical protein